MARAFGWSAIVSLAGIGLYFTFGHYLLAGNPYGVTRGLPPLLAAIGALVYLRRSARSADEAMGRAIGIAASVILIGFGLFTILTPLVTGSESRSSMSILTGMLLFAAAAPLVTHLVRSRSRSRVAARTVEAVDSPER